MRWGGVSTWSLSSRRFYVGSCSLSVLAADFNHDGTVDADDYVVWRKNPGGIYTQNDFNTWRAHFGQTTGSGSGTTSSATGSAIASVDTSTPAVPEPSTLVMLLVGVLLLGNRRRARAS